MALSSSGSISLQSIEGEWGGSSPISMSEYYSGALSNATNTLSDTQNATISHNNSSVYTPATKLIGAYTTYYYNAGWKNTNIASTNYPAMGSASATFNQVSGADASGNAGAIPSSGAIQFDHFRGTAKGTASSTICYGWMYTMVLGISNSYTLRLYVAGHHGPNYQSGGSWTGVPFRYVDTTAEGVTQTGSQQMPATRWYGSDTNVSNGANIGQNTKYHATYPNIGAATVYQYNCPANANPYHQFGSTTPVTMTFQF